MQTARSKSEPKRVTSADFLKITAGIQGVSDEQVLEQRAEAINGIMDRVKAAIPRRFRTHLLSVTDESYYDALNEGNSITVTGAVGSGKTTTAFAIAFRWIARHLQKVKDLQTVKVESLLYGLTATEYMFAIRNSYDDGSTDRKRDHAARASLLLIDDLFSARITDNTHEEILYLLNDRYQWERPFIVTTNKSLEEISQIDDRVSSRLASGLCVELKNEDRR